MNTSDDSGRIESKDVSIIRTLGRYLSLVSGAVAAVVGIAPVASVLFELGYFIVIRPELMRIARVEDYLSSVIIWLPLAALALVFSIVLSGLVDRGPAKNSPTRLSFVVNSLIFILINLFIILLLLLGVGSSHIIVFIVSVLLTLTSTSITVAVKIAAPEASKNLYYSLILAAASATFIVILGGIVASDDLKLRSGSVVIFISPAQKPLSANILRIYGEGILFKHSNSEKVEFVRWDGIDKLSYDRKDPIDSRTACKVLHIPCWIFPGTAPEFRRD